ncbi:MAG: hypothetical protein IJ607_07320 [Bacteroidaceae bacterium]|nr:hypothetical protein [Bacteroidaceae bacterium]
MNVKKIYGWLLSAITKIAGINAAKQFDSKLRFHRKINLKNPESLSDKVSYIELHDQSPLAPMCTDKAEVRKYVVQKGFKDILIPIILEPTDSVDKIDFKKLPETFILKATHGCRMNYIVKDKNRLDEEECKGVMRKWLQTTYGTYSMEPHYLSIPPRIYAEQYIEDMNGLIDYKFHCLNGKPEFCLVCSGRSDKKGESMGVLLSLFDMEWNFIDEIVDYKNEKRGPSDIPKPKQFDRMKEIAAELSKDFKFVRIDLYEYEGKILFGEMTFSPACCVFPYFSDAFDKAMGKKLVL